METKRLFLRKIEAHHFDYIYDLHSDPEVMQHIWSGTRSKEQVQAWLAKVFHHQEKHGFCLSAVFEKETKKFVGIAGLFYLGFDDSQPDIACSYILHKAFWNKGYATEVSKGVIEWGFKFLSLKRIIAVVDPSNIGSRRVLEKSNMRYVKETAYKNKLVALYEATV